MKDSIKIMYEQLGLTSGSPIKVKRCDYDYFKYPWHFHDEYEIVYIIRSTGTRFVGNSIEPFADGDLVFFGSMLPHMYRNDDIYHQGTPSLRVHAITIQFSKDFFNHAILNYPEFLKIKKLLDAARYGICFGPTPNAPIRRRIESLPNKKGLERLLECIHILSMMSRTTHKRRLNDDSVEQHLPPAAEARICGDSRIYKVLGKLNREYVREINLEEIAQAAGMNSSAFCRYFKEKTGKSTLQYINELRIGYACKLLLTGELSVTQICYECGYNNISNFNRHFKRITRHTPSEYIEEFRHDLRPIIHRE